MSSEAHDAAVESIGEKMFGAEPAEEVQEEVNVEAEEVTEEVEAQDGVENQLENEDSLPDKDASELHEVSLGDNLYEVPIEIKDAIEKSNDYTQKTQAVSAERKQLEVIHGSLASQQSEYSFVESIGAEVTEAQMLKQQIGQWKQHKRNNIDALSIQEIVKIDSEVEQLTERGKAISDSVTLKHQEHQRATEQTRKELRVKSTEVLKGRIPGWNETADSEVGEFATSMGFAQQEYENSLDPREKEVLWMASQYRRLQDGKSAAIKRVQTAPIKAKARNPMPDSVKSRLNTRKKLKTKGLSNKDKSSIIQDDIAKRLGL